MEWASQSRQAWLRNLEWRQGEHVAIIGKTGSGKTTLARDLLMKRDYVVVTAVKREDDTLDTFKDYRRVSTWPPDFATRRALLWVRPRGIDDAPRQRQIIGGMMRSIFLSGGWAVDLDDTGYVANVLGLSRSLVMLLNQGRALGLSIVTSMNRPASATQRIPLEAFNQTAHVVMFKMADERETRRMAQIAGTPHDLLRAAMDTLKRHEFVYADGDGRLTVVAA